MKQQREPYSALGSSGMDTTVYSFHVHVHWQPSPSSGVQVQLAVAFQCTQKDSEEGAVMRDYQWAVFCHLTPPPPTAIPYLHHPPPQLSLPPSSSLSHTISSSITGAQFTDVGT